MKLIYRQVSLFALLLVILASGFYVINQYVFSKVKPILPDSIHYISLGTSLSRYALSDEIIPNFANYSLEGRSGLSTYKSLQVMVEHNPNLKGVVVDMSLMGMMAYRDLKFLLPNFAAREFTTSYPFSGYSDYSHYPLNYKYYMLSQMHHEWTPNVPFWKNYLTKRRGENPDLSIFPYLGSFKTIPFVRNNIKIDAWMKRYNVLESLVGKDIMVSTYDLAYVDSILEYSRTMEPRLFVYAAPLNKKVLEVMPDQFKDKYNLLMSKSLEYPNVKVLNFTEFEMPDSCYVNYTHTNIYGAELISKAFADSLQVLKELNNGI